MIIANKYNCLSTISPQLAGEWHPTKNDKLRPEGVTSGSGKRVWWKCKNGHEWIAEVCSRSSGRGCPYCSGRYASKNNCLGLVDPKLASEWHLTKNGKLTPQDVMPNSSKKVHWICKMNHEWEATINSRSSGCGCPYCSGRKATKEDNLLVLFPDIAKEWHPTKNDNLRPEDFRFKSGKAIYWKCARGHEWKESIINRANGCNCPYCAGHKVCKENCLATLNPRIAKEWHPTKNGKLTPRDVTITSSRGFYWQDEKGHEWKTTISHRVSGQNCPYCGNRRANKENSLAIKKPGLLKEWDYERNKGIDPNEVVYGSTKKVGWICSKRHRWKSEIRSRYKGCSCPYCCVPPRKVDITNCLATIRPHLVKEWDYIKNGDLTPYNVTYASSKKVHWICKMGHKWRTVISSRANGNNCPYCYGQKACDDNCLATLEPEMSLEWDYKKKR